MKKINEIIHENDKIREISKFYQKQDLTIGFVPTMGALHSGHLSLIEKAKEKTDIVVVSIFVNPKQFAPHEDFEKYPRNLETDAKLAFDSGANYIFSPDILGIYPIGYSTNVIVKNISDKFEGEFRPQFFEGVATVCTKLFNIVEPDEVFFGQKDYQQCMVIKRLITDLNFGFKFTMVPTEREANGLAKSSRNVYLSDNEKELSSILFLAMEQARIAISKGEDRRKIINAIMHKKLREVKEIKIDYAASALADSLETPEIFLAGESIVLLLAVYLGKVRLIDNMIIKF